MSLHGKEGSLAERQQASTMIERWMRARAAKDFVEECRYFSRQYVKTLVAEDAQRVTEGRVKSCPRALAYFGSSASGDFKNTLTGPINSLRVPEPGPSSGDPNPTKSYLGFAQYHGKGGIDYAIPMNREGGRWWVAAAAPLQED